MMTLKSIELAGFKSFGKKSTLSFTTPLTGVVGPNGSGKSNIVESIRFVLGEQSMKSLRGKGGVDLIFKGSKTVSAMNRASVTITFDNSAKIFSFTNSGLGVSLDYDEISISREVYTDGVNKYSINGTEVRLKDVTDLLASVNIGSSGHHIISQGEADRVLNASNKDRRSMIEDALGLKVYQYRIRESERKLEKTQMNMKEVAAERREVAPHLAFLKKQVEKVEKAHEMREQLRLCYAEYFSREATYVAVETTRLTHIRRVLDEKIVLLDERITKLKSTQQTKPSVSLYDTEIKGHEQTLADIRTQKDELSRKLGRIEGTLESIDRERARIPKVTEQVITESQWRGIVADIEAHINEALQSEDLPTLRALLSRMKERLGTLHTQTKDTPRVVNEELDHEYEELKSVHTTLAEEIRDCGIREVSCREALAHLRLQEQETQKTLHDSERVLYELLGERNTMTSDMHSLSYEEEKLTLIKTAYEMELAEAGILIGREVIDYTRMPVEGDVVRSQQEELRRKIERLKIKLEDAGSSNGAEIMKEYTHAQERDAFLVKEIEDLHKGIDMLEELITELKATLEIQFKQGIEKINIQFQEFFALMFGGGSAHLSVTMENKPLKNISGDLADETDGLGEDAEIRFERGIEINVTLPHKKVKDLHMLSGGERSLASIALLFAISQVNPPPFLVLDETDAALDEANSRKYGNMLENLSQYSQLVVVTHNRETMSRAQVLYGVTMDSSGVSKLLSIHLQDASIYAK